MSNTYKTQQGQYHGPLPVRDFFPMPNAIFNLGLTAEEIAIYIAPVKNAMDVYYYHQIWNKKNIPYLKSRERKKRR